jgi:hypothetical protein
MNLWNTKGSSRDSRVSQKVNAPKYLLPLPFSNGSLNLFRRWSKPAAKLQRFWKLFLFRLLTGYIPFGPIGRGVFHRLGFLIGKDFHLDFIVPFTFGDRSSSFTFQED